MISQNNTNFEYVVVFLSETICAGHLRQILLPVLHEIKR